MIQNSVNLIYLLLGVSVTSVLTLESVIQADSNSRNQLPTISPPESVSSKVASNGLSLGMLNGKPAKAKGGVDIKAIKDRMDKGSAIVSGIVSTFAGSGDSSTLEDSFSKYDELMEDIEADLTKAKIGLGLRLEESLKSYKKSSDQFFRQLRSFGNSGGWTYNWGNNQVGNGFPQLDENDLKKRAVRFNELLNRGFENFLEMSERGKDILRRMYKKRYEMRNGVVAPTHQFKNNQVNQLTTM